MFVEGERVGDSGGGQDARQAIGEQPENLSDIGAQGPVGAFDAEFEVEHIRRPLAVGTLALLDPSDGAAEGPVRPSAKFVDTAPHRRGQTVAHRHQEQGGLEVLLHPMFADPGDEHSDAAGFVEWE